MPSEDITREQYLASGTLRGNAFGDFEALTLGATYVSELVTIGVTALVPSAIDYPFTRYTPPKKPASAKPDRVYLRREADRLLPVAAEEWKQANRLTTSAHRLEAGEQALFAALALGVHIGVVSGGSTTEYVDVQASTAAGELRYFDETRDLNPGVLSNLLAGDAGVVRDPKPLAESVWQTIWHATKAEPKECLLTFVEIFVILKFLSDNLPSARLPADYSFYRLIEDPAKFYERTGKTATEYYVTDIRPRIKTLFPDNVMTRDEHVPEIFGLKTLVSKTSVINGFAFLRSSQESLVSFDRTFREILDAFQAFGPLTAIDPEFKLRLYETFLRKSARQQRLGQFFTPRNIVRPMVRMARLDLLPDGAVVLDPAAGVGGFLLEPLLFEDSLPGNVQFKNGQPQRRIRTVGVDIDADLHILAKANALLHLAEAVRSPATSTAGLNAALADTFALMNENETLGALLNPPRDAVDVVLTNPPYVTQGSAIYRSELKEVKGTRNGLDLREYYEGSGLGVESLFLRYISGALKPGGRAFVIVPLGMLNRTETGPKANLLRECNLLGSIQLPRNAFFNTAQPTYILILEKRHTSVDERPPVFCGIARSTGETLDYERVPTPDDNDLMDIAELFIRHSSGEDVESPVVRVVPAIEFTENERWDVPRFWTDADLVDLGERAPAVPRLTFIEELTSTLATLHEDLTAAHEEFKALTSWSHRRDPAQRRDARQGPVRQPSDQRPGQGAPRRRPRLLLLHGRQERQGARRRRLARRTRDPLARCGVGHRQRQRRQRRRHRVHPREGLPAHRRRHRRHPGPSRHRRRLPRRGPREQRRSRRLPLRGEAVRPPGPRALGAPAHPGRRHLRHRAAAPHRRRRQAPRHHPAAPHRGRQVQPIREDLLMGPDEAGR